MLERACNRHTSARFAKGARGACSFTITPCCLLKWDRAEGSVRQQEKREHPSEASIRMELAHTRRPRFGI